MFRLCMKYEDFLAEIEIFASRRLRFWRRFCESCGGWGSLGWAPRIPRQRDLLRAVLGQAAGGRHERGHRRDVPGGKASSRGGCRRRANRTRPGWEAAATPRRRGMANGITDQEGTGHRGRPIASG